MLDSRHKLSNRPAGDCRLSLTAFLWYLKMFAGDHSARHRPPEETNRITVGDAVGSNTDADHGFEP